MSTIEQHSFIATSPEIIAKHLSFSCDQPANHKSGPAIQFDAPIALNIPETMAPKKHVSAAHYTDLGLLDSDRLEFLP